MVFIIQVSMSGCCGGRDLRCLRGLGFNSCNRVWQLQEGALGQSGVHYSGFYVGMLWRSRFKVP